MSAKRRPVSSFKTPTEDDLGIQVQCVPAALSTRQIKKSTKPKLRASSSQKPREKSKNDTNEVTIPLRVHISLSVPPPSPVAPCTTPDSLSEEELDCFPEDENIASEDNESMVASPSPKFRNVTFRGRRSSSMSSTTTRNSSNKSIPDLSIKSKQSQLQGRPHSSPRTTSSSKADSGCYSRCNSKSSNKSRPQTRKSIFERNALVRTPRGPPNDALQVKRCGTPDDDKKARRKSCDHKSGKASGENRGVIKVRKSDNAFVMSEDGSIKKCTVFIPINSDGDSTNVSPTHQETDLNGVDEYVDFYKPVTCHRLQDSTERIPCMEEQQSEEFRIIVKSRGKIVNVKDSCKQKCSKQAINRERAPPSIPSSPIPSQTKHGCINEPPLFVEGTDILLSQFQHKTEEITFCDVLHSLNVINDDTRQKISETDQQNSKDVTANSMPKTSLLRVWNEKDTNGKTVNIMKKTKSNILTRINSRSQEAKEVKQKVAASVSTSQCNKKAYSILSKMPPSSRKMSPSSKPRSALRAVSHYNYQTVVLSNSPTTNNKK